MISFAPLDHDAITMLERHTGLDFGHDDFTEPKWFCCTARDGQRKIQGLLVAEFTSWFEAHITSVIVDPRFMSRRLLRAIFTALFSRAVRVTAYAEPGNHVSIKALKQLGFIYEGFLRLGIDGRRDGMIFGMLRNDCRWLKKPARQVFKEAAE